MYVHGNHDGCYRTEGEPGGCICVDDQVYVWKGLRIMEMCIRDSYHIALDSGVIGIEKCAEIIESLA